MKVCGAVLSNIFSYLFDNALSNILEAGKQNNCFLADGSTASVWVRHFSVKQSLYYQVISNKNYTPIAFLIFHMNQSCS